MEPLEKAINRLKKMTGKSYLSNKVNIRIENYTHKNGVVEICTDKGWKKMPEDELEDFIDECLPVSMEIAAPSNTAVAVFELVKKESDQMGKLAEILMGNIQKIQDDPGFIEKARAINETAKNLIEIKKTQVEMFNLLKG